MRKFRESKGFTLIELMVVVAIIGILAAVAVPKFLQFLARSRKSEARTILTGVFNAQEAYFAEYEWYGGGAGDDGVLWRVGWQPAGVINIYVDNLGWALGADAGGGAGAGVGTQQLVCPPTTPGCTAVPAYTTPIGGSTTDAAATPGAFVPSGAAGLATGARGFTFVMCGNTDSDGADFDAWWITQSAREPCNTYDDLSNVVAVAERCTAIADVAAVGLPGAGC